MTIKEAKEVLQEQIDKYGQEYDDEGIEALEIAIKILEKEPCEDCISREAVINHICESKDCYKKECKGRIYKRCFDLQWIYDLPPVKPYKTESEVK